MWILPENVNKALGILHENGFEGYLVGGCVRDRIMNREIHDYDITTNAKTDELKQIFSGYQQILAGEKHGTVSVVIHGEVLEITTYRSDGEYLDGRHPESVTFVTDLKEDVSRRDFTMNAIAYNDKEGYVDYFNGLEDIKCSVIRCVGDADTRFKEDALRIMRGVRFSAQFGFDLETKTLEAAINNRYLLGKVSKERIFTELCKLVAGKYAGKAVRDNIIVLSAIIPELSEMIDFTQDNPHHNLNLLDHTVRVVDNLPYDISLRLAGLFHDIAKPKCVSVDSDGIKHFYNHPVVGEEMVRGILLSLRSDSKTLEDVCTLVRYHDHPIENTPQSIKKMLSKIGERLFFMLMDLKIADNIAQDPKYRRTDLYYDIISSAKEIIAKEECFSLKDMKLNGKDILSLGVKPSKAVGECLNYLLENVIEGKFPNEREFLMNEVKMYFGLQ
ncbi:MAG: HD domain-containing protein [Anaerofustis stercorihominis]|nr:HD domain-containing protein [Anaerofustis stercorihominis]